MLKNTVFRMLGSDSAVFRLSTPDPYDLWASPAGVSIRKCYYSGDWLGRSGAVALGLIDWLLPRLGRRWLGVTPIRYPIVVAHQVLIVAKDGGANLERNGATLVEILRQVAAEKGVGGRWSWGLGFPWMSKNGLYGPEVPFVTHTPYVMEALLALAGQPALRGAAMEMFHGTLGFLESLKVMEEGDGELALSYAPIDEPRIVVNANAYAAFAHALHAVHGREAIRTEAADRAERLARWVIRQQRADGSWFYYADDGPGNFIDCFHSCFVVKNLLKVKGLLPHLSDLVDEAVVRGWGYIRSVLYDERAGLCRRFALRAQRDPFRWDLYDQAEFLGLLVDFGELERATHFAEHVEKRFRKGEHWYCRIDLFGRRWGRDFLRWGIVPFWYHRRRLETALESTAEWGRRADALDERTGGDRS